MHAVLMSERVLKEDVYTSIHISEFDVAAVTQAGT
jgi:DNA-directed RNA polymerase beta subunit